MKVDIARIKLTLRTSKVLADGTSPILLKVSFGGSKELATHYSCSSKYWDKKAECVKKGFPNYAAINKAITELKSKAIDARSHFEALGGAYTPQMILDYIKDDKPSQKLYCDILNDYITENQLSKNTIKQHKVIYRKLAAIIGREAFIPSEVDSSTIRRLIASMGNISEGSKKNQLNYLRAVVNYAMEKGLIVSDPFKGIKLSKMKTAISDLYIKPRTLEYLKQYLINEIAIINGERWAYKIDIDELWDRNSAIYPLFFYLLGVLFQGLAPTDLVALKHSDVKIEDKFYKIDGKRRKTNVPYKIRIPRGTMYNEIVMKAILMTPSEYILPILDSGSEFSYNRISWWLQKSTPKLKQWFGKVNEKIIEYNVDHDDDRIPLIDLKCTYYSYRHTYAQWYLTRPNANMVALSTLLGRSINGIGTYVKQLTEESELEEAVQ